MGSTHLSVHARTEEPTMAAPNGAVRVRHQDQAVTFQVLGWGTMRQSLCFRRCAEQALAAGVQSVRVDLRHCTYLDSTFLGTLVTLQRAACRLGRKFALVCPSPGCCRLFRQVGVEDIFASEAADEPGDEGWTDLGGEREDAGEFNRNVVQAHEQLADLGGPAAEAFGQVARQLRRECGPGPGP
jgi:anti-anti-sigma factor